MRPPSLPTVHALGDYVPLARRVSWSPPLHRRFQAIGPLVSSLVRSSPRGTFGFTDQTNHAASEVRLSASDDLATRVSAADHLFRKFWRRHSRSWTS